MKKLSMIIVALSLLSSFSHASMLEVRSYANKNYVVFTPASLSNLVLGLKDTNGKVLGGFDAWQKQLKPCQTLKFGMNAGMYHPNYQAVGLYIENSKIDQSLNTADGFGNFFMKPNGVVAWNDQKALISQTQNWDKSKFKAHYATQSGPMLVIDGKVMSKLIPNSDSKKIRNGVGIKAGQLFFVMSEQRVSFYEFAEFFQKSLGVEQALYLDGSISSIYAPEIRRHDRAFKLGPMLGYIESTCKN